MDLASVISSYISDVRLQCENAMGQAVNELLFLTWMEIMTLRLNEFAAWLYVTWHSVSLCVFERGKSHRKGIYGCPMSAGMKYSCSKCILTHILCYNNNQALVNVVCVYLCVMDNSWLLL